MKTDVWSLFTCKTFKYRVTGERSFPAFIALETLEETKIGKIVNKWASKKRNLKYEDVRQQAASLVSKWKDIVREKAQLLQNHQVIRGHAVRKQLPTDPPDFVFERVGEAR